MQAIRDEWPHTKVYQQADFGSSALSVRGNKSVGVGSDYRVQAAWAGALQMVALTEWLRLLAGLLTNYFSRPCSTFSCG